MSCFIHSPQRGVYGGPFPVHIPLQLVHIPWFPVFLFSFKFVVWIDYVTYFWWQVQNLRLVCLSSDLAAGFPCAAGAVFIDKVLTKIIDFSAACTSSIFSRRPASVVHHLWTICSFIGLLNLWRTFEHFWTLLWVCILLILLLLFLIHLFLSSLHNWWARVFFLSFPP